MSAKSAKRKRQVSAGLLSNHNADLPDGGVSPVGGLSKHVAIEMNDVTTQRPRTHSSNDGSDNYDTSSFTITKDLDDANGSQSTPGINASINDNASQHISVVSNPADRKDTTSIGQEFPRDTSKSSLQYENNKESTFLSDIGSARQSTALPESRISDQSMELDLPCSRTNSSRSGNRSDTPGVEALDSEYYCVDHMKLCSSEEAQTEHVSCEFLVPAFEWAEAQTMERDRRNTEEKLKRFETFAGTLMEERSMFKQQLAESKDDVTEEFLDVVEDLIAQLLSKQKDFMSSLDKLHEGHMKTINDQIKRCMKIQKETSFSLQQLDSCSVDSDEFKILKKKIMDKCPVYEEILRRDFNNSSRLDYEFRPNPWVDNFFKNMTSLGDVITRPLQSKLPGFLSQSRETDFSRRQLHITSRNDGVSGSDNTTCCFSGCTFVSGGRMILADWNNVCLKMFNKRGVLCDRLNFPNNPWDVKVIDDERVVVTVPGERTVFIVSYNGQQMQVVSSFETDCECWAVAVIGDKFAMTCDPWSKTPNVRMFTMEGKYVAFYQKDSKGKQLFSYPEHITTDADQSVMYISDSRLHMVIALTVEGCLLFRYNHKELVYPAGVATDGQGYVYICGKESRNVHQVSKTGEFVKILMEAEDLEAPRAICFQPDGESMIVTDVGNSNCDEFITAKLE